MSIQAQQCCTSAAVLHQCSSAAGKGWRFVPRCHPAWSSEGTPVGPGKDPPVHWGLNSRKAVGGPFGSDTRYTANMVVEQVVENK